MKSGCVREKIDDALEKVGKLVRQRQHSLAASRRKTEAPRRQVSKGTIKRTRLLGGTTTKKECIGECGGDRTI